MSSLVQQEEEKQPPLIIVATKSNDVVDVTEEKKSVIGTYLMEENIPQTWMEKMKTLCDSISTCAVYVKLKEWQNTFDEIKFFSPIIRQYADVASDIGVLVTFGSKIYSNNSSNINYPQLFAVSLFIQIFSRVIGSFIIYTQFSHSKRDAILHLFDLYILTIIHKGVKYGYEEGSNIRSWVSSLESLFESSPQLIISLYVLFVSQNEDSAIDPLIFVSFLISLSSVANSAVSQDCKYLSKNFKEWKKNFILNGLLKVWRIGDVMAHCGFYLMIWIYRSGFSVSICVLIQLFGTLMAALIFDGDIYAIHAMLVFVPWVTKVNIWTNVWWISTAIITSIVLWFDDNSNNSGNDDYVGVELPNWVFILTICGFGFSLLYTGIFSAFGMKSIVTTRSIQGCQNMEQLETLIKFGYQMKIHEINLKQTWVNFEEPSKLLDYIFDTYLPMLYVKKLYLDNYSGSNSLRLRQERIDYEQIIKYILQNKNTSCISDSNNDKENENEWRKLFVVANKPVIFIPQKLKKKSLWIKVLEKQSEKLSKYLTDVNQDHCVLQNSKISNQKDYIKYIQKNHKIPKGIKSHFFTQKDEIHETFLDHCISCLECLPSDLIDFQCCSKCNMCGQRNELVHASVINNE